MALGEPRLGPSGVVERRAAVAPRAFALPSLLSVDETRRLLACTLDFARGPDSVDREPTFECFVFDRGDVLSEGACRALEAPLLGRALPYLRERFKCATLEPYQALVRRYLPSERRKHPAHFDAHAFVTLVVALNDADDYDGGYYAQPTPRPASARFAPLARGDGFAHGFDLRHGVRVDRGSRYSLVCWFKPRSCATTSATPWYDRAAARGDADALYNVGARACVRARGAATAAARAALEAEGEAAYEAAAARGSADAALNLGVLRHGRGDRAAAIGAWRAAARAGKAAAQRYLGRALLAGDGAARDEAAARRWLRRAAAGGDGGAAHACWALGGDARDLDAAAALGHAPACVDAAEALLDAAPDRARDAVQLLRRAASNGAPAAAAGVLGRLYLADAPGVPVDLAAAAECFVVARTRDADARLAVLYCGGRVPRPLARYWKPAERRARLALVGL